LDKNSSTEIFLPHTVTVSQSKLSTASGQLIIAYLLGRSSKALSTYYVLHTKHTGIYFPIYLLLHITKKKGLDKGHNFFPISLLLHFTKKGLGISALVGAKSEFIQKILS
jgi:hypothetical protein